jgi:uncharacterized membrane protein
MAKTISFRILYFNVAFTVRYLLTSSLMVGGLLTIVEPNCNTFMFYFHEKALNTQQEKHPAKYKHANKFAWLHMH